MSIAFACPGCAKPFRVADELAGRRSKCPSCGTAMMVPHVGAVQPPPAPQPMYAPSYEPYAAEPATAPRPVKRGKGKFKRMALLSLVVLALVGVAAVGYYFVSGPSGPSGDDLRYLPNNCQMIASIKVEQLLGSKVYEDLKKELPEGKQNPDKDVEGMLGIPASAISQVIVGGSYGGGMEQEFLVVVKTNKAITAADIIQGKKGSKYEEEKVGSYTLNKNFMETFCVADSKTVIFAVFQKPDLLKKVLERDKKPELSDSMQAALKQADFSRTVALAVNLKDLRTKFKPAGSMSNMGGPMVFDPSTFVDVDDVDGIAMNIQVGSDVKLSTTALCKDSNSASDVRKLADGMMVVVKKIKVVPKDVQDILATWDASTSGSKMTGSLTFKVEPIVKLIKDAGQPRTRTFQKVGSAISGGPPTAPRPPQDQ